MLPTSFQPQMIADCGVYRGRTRQNPQRSDVPSCHLGLPTAVLLSCAGTVHSRPVWRIPKPNPFSLSSVRSDQKFRHFHLNETLGEVVKTNLVDYFYFFFQSCFIAEIEETN